MRAVLLSLAILGSLTDNCRAGSPDHQVETEPVAAQDQPAGEEVGSLLEERLAAEARSRSSRFTLLPHNRNFLLPLSYRQDPNIEPYQAAGNADLVEQQKVEVEFQFSVKVLLLESIFGDNGHLYMAYTNRSFWQAYHQDVSRPFRETNHQPELVLSFINAWDFLGFRNTANELILNHQSNGLGGRLSRSWNRVMFNTLFERGNFAFSFKPWYRIPEGDGYGPDDPTGDSNPDIERYLGHFEWSGAYRHDQQIFSMVLRNNLRSDNYGALELDWSFPISSTVRGYIKYFNGYGHSLIDYDTQTQALGVGIAFTDLF